MEKEMKYEAPIVEIIEVEVEQGFVGTGNAPDSDDSDFGGPTPT